MILLSYLLVLCYVADVLLSCFVQVIISDTSMKLVYLLV
jgi:hypothetical protein